MRAGGAILCAADDGASYPLLLELFTDQPSEGSAGYSDADLTELAGAAGASAEVGDCISSGTYVDAIEQNTDKFLAEGYAGTPTVLVNGEEINGDADDLAEAIDNA